MKMRTIAPIALLLLALTANAAAAADMPHAKRKATLQWKVSQGAALYEIQIAATKTFEKPLIMASTGETAFVCDLAPGEYYFRIRPLDRRKEPGVWSKTEGFVVIPRPPKLIAPAQAVQFKTLLPMDGIEFSWEEQEIPVSHPFEIRDEFGVVFQRNLDSHKIPWIPTKPGKYRWRVGSQTRSGEEWGAIQNFEVLPSALPPLREVKRETKIPPYVGARASVGAGFSTLAVTEKASGLTANLKTGLEEACLDLHLTVSMFWLGLGMDYKPFGVAAGKKSFEQQNSWITRAGLGTNVELFKGVSFVFGLERRMDFVFLASSINDFYLKSTPFYLGVAGFDAKVLSSGALEIETGARVAPALGVKSEDSVTGGTFWNGTFGVYLLKPEVFRIKRLGVRSTYFLHAIDTTINRQRESGFNTQILIEAGL